MSLFDVDPNRSASHRTMAEHLSGPFRDSAIETPVPITRVNGVWTARVDWVSRRSVLLVELRAPLAERARNITLNVLADGQTAPTVPPPTIGLASARAGLAPFAALGSVIDDGFVAGSIPATATLCFAPFSEAGTALPAWPPTPPDDAVPPFTITIGDPLDGAAIDELIALRVVEGNLGRLLYLIGAEKARLRRQARELHELHHLSFVFDDASPDHLRMGHALDRLGAELGVPRLTDRLSWDVTNQTVTSETAAEPNEAYRHRLALYRPFVLSTPGGVASLLRDGAGAALATVTESNTEHALAVRLVSSPNDAPRQAFLDWVRNNQLVQPGQPIPESRLLPRATRIEQAAALTRVATTFQFPTGSFLSPLLVDVLDQIGRCRTALGVTRPWHVLRAQDSAGGSRFELGLGVELEVPPAAELDTLARNLAQQQLAAGTDVETLALLGSLTGASSAVDPIGRWLLAGCGAVTVHPTASGIFVSRVGMFGAVIAAGATPNTFEGRFEAPGDPGQNAVLFYGLHDVATDAAAHAIPAWTELAAAAATTARAAATLATPAIRALFNSVRLTTPATTAELARTIAALLTVPPELMTTVRLDAGFAASLLASDTAAWAKLKLLVGYFTARELGSVLPLVTSNSVMLVVGAQALPGASVLVHAERLAFRWHAVPITGQPGTLARAGGPRNTYTPPPAAVPSLVALVAVSLARSDRDDPRDRIPPYSARIELPAGSLIDLATYERMMNVLERLVPIGTVLDTRRLREQNVDPAQVRQAVPLTGRLARSFRTFQLDRRFGVVGDDPAQ